jgi:hypothetical protein
MNTLLERNWRVTHFNKPFDDRITPQDFACTEDIFSNYDAAEERATSLEKSPDAYDIKIWIYEGDDCIDEMEQEDVA